jgi:uncharacterized protein YodC (DUF2158 family)
VKNYTVGKITPLNEKITPLKFYVSEFKFSLDGLSEHMTEETKLKVGDVVELNSGGPLMTVLSLKSDTSVRCVWFNTHQGKVDIVDFNNKCLTLKETNAS